MSKEKLQTFLKSIGFASDAPKDTASGSQKLAVKKPATKSVEKTSIIEDQSNRIFFDTAPLTDADFKEGFYENDALFSTLLSARPDELFDYISRETGLDPHIAKTVCEIDRETWRNALKAGTFAREESLRTRVAARFIVYNKNKHVMERLGQIFPGREGYLDVGCGMGFTMLTAKQIGYQKAHGLEVDPAFAMRGLKFMKEGFDEDLGYVLGDFLTYECRPPYDLITFFDVMEHIGDHDLAITKSLSSLSDNGSIYFYQGNYRSTQMVYTEPHYRLPLLTLLPKELVQTILLRARKIKAADEYVVNIWPELDLFHDPRWKTRLDETEVNFRTDQKYPSTKHCNNQLEALSKVVERDLKPLLEPEEHGLIEETLQKYKHDFNALQAKDKAEHRRRYLLPSWNVALSNNPEALGSFG